MEIFGIFIPLHYVVLIFVLHIIISIVVTFFVTLYISKRYVSNTKFAKENDKMRLGWVEHRSSIFKALFKFSLHKYNPISTRIFFLLFNISVPVIGYLASLWLAYYLVHIKYEKKVLHTNILNLDEFGTSFLKVERIFGEGSMSNVMLNEDVPKSKKLKALSSLSNNMSPMTLRIIKQTLSSKNDEIRMYGYAIINKVEKKLNEDINIFLEVYKTSADDDEKKYEAAKELAFSYWEMIYTELSHESLRENFLVDVVKYLEIAKGYFMHRANEFDNVVDEYERKLEVYTQKEALKSDDLAAVAQLRETINEKRLQLKHYRDTTAKLFILMGRVYMMRNDHNNAITEFTVAQELSESDSSFVLPYLAEIYFKLRKFHIVKSILEKAYSLELNPKLYPIVQQWRSHDS